MKIKATYRNEDLAYIVQIGEQTLTIPDECMSKFVSAVEVVYSRQRRTKAERVMAARKVVEDSNHPDVLPFCKERPPRKPPGRPKGIKYTAPIEQRLKKSKPKKQSPPKNEEPFKHTIFR